jgi:hypothetical protein
VVRGKKGVLVTFYSRHIREEHLDFKLVPRIRERAKRNWLEQPFTMERGVDFSFSYAALSCTGVVLGMQAIVISSVQSPC